MITIPRIIIWLIVGFLSQMASQLYIAKEDYKVSDINTSLLFSVIGPLNIIAYILVEIDKDRDVLIKAEKEDEKK